MPQKLSRITVGVLDSLPTCSVHSLTQLVFVGLASGCLVGCYNSEQVCNDAAAVAPSVELGSWTDDSFFPIEEEAVVSPVWGPQGGQHIWAAVLATGVNPGDGEMVSESGGWLDFLFPQPVGRGAATVAEGHDPVSITFSMQYEEDLLAQTSVTFDAFLSGDVEMSVSSAQTVFVDAWEISEAYPEHDFVEAVMHVELLDACGTKVEDEVSILIEQSGYY